VLRLHAARKTTETVELGMRYPLVTPVSGAVVLETKQQYQRAGLTPSDPATVPTIPEPSTWLLVVAAFSVLACARQRHVRARRLRETSGNRVGEN
jgi:hypothetical protein